MEKLILKINPERLGIPHMAQNVRETGYVKTLRNEKRYVLIANSSKNVEHTTRGQFGGGVDESPPFMKLAR